MGTPVVIIVAMESERQHLDTLIPGWEVEKSGVWATHRNGDVVAITCGIGMVAAAAATEHAIATHSPAMILNFGCAGAHLRDLFPGDVVIGERTLHQGRMRFAADGRIVALDIGFTVPGEVEPVAQLTCDPTLANLAVQIANEVDLPVWPAELRLRDQPQRSPVIRLGTVSSGDIWLQDIDCIDDVNRRTGSLCEDMEAASIAQICAYHGVPFLTVKDISNSEFHETTVFDESSSALPTNAVGLRSAIIVAQLIQKLKALGDLKLLRYS